MTRTLGQRIVDFFIHLGVGIAVGSLTGLIESHPLLWIFVSIWVAISLARQP